MLIRFQITIGASFFKYIWRWPHKEDPLNDLKKAEFYLKNLINRLENEKK